MDSVTSPGEIQFDEILRAEIRAINRRRAALGRVALGEGGPDGLDGTILDATGLTLSGGGIRSAAFSLGVLQALNHHDALRNIDYLSTVSGGGYMGCALTATMTHTDGSFVFGNRPPDGGAQAVAEIADTPEVGHLRNYSNYLIPRGARDVGTGLVIVLRGLLANLAGVLGCVLLAAALTIMTNPYRSEIGCVQFAGFDLCKSTAFGNYNMVFTLFAALAGGGLFFAWAIYRSFLPADRLSEFRTKLPALALIYLCFVVVLFFLELQPVVLQGMFDSAEFEGDPDPLAWLTNVLKALAAFAAPVAAVVTFFRQQLGDIMKAATAQAGIVTKAIAAMSKAAFWVAGAALPLLIWVLYLYLSYWGIDNDLARDRRADVTVVEQTQKPSGVEKRSAAEQAADEQRRKISSMSGTGYPTGMDLALPDFSKEGGPTAEILACTVPRYDVMPSGAHTPAWMIIGATKLSQGYFCRYLWWMFEHTYVTRWMFAWVLYRPMVLAYGTIGFLLLLFLPLLRPNANSLHGLYRDRLSKAFLFDPRKREGPPPARNEASNDQGRDFAALDDFKVSKLSSACAPYHLINAALNIQGSDYANRRGRDADFFLISPCHTGSYATGYAATQEFEKEAKGLNVATAMAISGAAASSNMGSRSITPLRPTLALLNIRLGYWMNNPRYVMTPRKKVWWRPSDYSGLFLINEIFGRLYENSNNVYLTDGGHIENLGVYELLRRRCKLIVVVDAEADIAVRFSSLITLQRYARIDLGIRIDMPWDSISKTTSAWMGLHNKDQDATPSQGPHAAVGCIDYGNGKTGLILYLKASLSGDENDYILDYARRFQLFPHESTGDQFFSEEQFEVYRALGFHIAHGVLSGRDNISAPGKPCGFNSQDNSDVHAIRETLLARPLSPSAT